MRALVVSDLHSNAEALRVVMNRVRRKKFDQVICLGDFVGYGAQPNQVLDTMRTMKAPKLYIRGNHDRVAAGLDDAEGFNNAAQAAALWTRDHLSARNRHFLAQAPARSRRARRRPALPRRAAQRGRVRFPRRPRPRHFRRPPTRRSSSTATRTCR